MATPSATPDRLPRALLFVHLLLSPLVFSKDTVEVFEYNKVALLLLAALALAACYVPRGLRVPRDAVSLGFLLFLLSAAASTLASISPWTSIFGCHESFAGIFTISAYTVLFFATRAAIGDPAAARRLLLATVVAAAVASTYAVCQVTKIDPIRWGRISPWKEYIRPFATMGHPNFLSAFLAMAVPVVAYSAGRALERRAWLPFGSLVLVGALSVGAIVISISRGAWLALFCAVVTFGALLFAARRVPRARATALALAAIFGTAALGGAAAAGAGRLRSMVESVTARAQHLTDAASREHIWRAGLGMFADHPLFGCGLDAFQLAFEQKRTVEYWNTEWNGTPTKAHNEAIHILATQGLFGAVATLVMTGGLVLLGVRAWRRAAPGDRPLLAAISAGLVAFYVQDLFSFTVAGCGTLFVTYAALVSRFGAAEAPEARAPDPLGWFTNALIAADLLAAAVFFYNVGDASAAAAAPEPKATRALAGLVMIASFFLPSLAAQALERADAPARPEPAVLPHRRYKQDAPLLPDRGALARRGAAWAVALVLAIVGVVTPWRANAACREGGSLASQVPFMPPGQQRSLAAYAVKRLEDAIALDPTKELYFVKLGTAAQMAAKVAATREERIRYLGRAREAFARSIELIPENSYDHANLGRVLGDLAREGLVSPAEVYAAFDQALALDRNNAYFYADAANAALGLGDLARARFYAEKGAALYPRFAPAVSLAGYVALLDKRYEDAVRSLEQAIAGDWHEDANGPILAETNLAAALLRLERYAEAARAAEAALAIAPRYAEARFNLGKALEGLGRKDEAIAAYRAVLAERPDHELSREALKALGVAPERPAEGR